MSKFTTLVSKFANEDEGAALIEYSILIGLIAAAVIVSITAVGAWITGRWGSLVTALTP